MSRCSQYETEIPLGRGSAPGFWSRQAFVDYVLRIWSHAEGSDIKIDGHTYQSQPSIILSEKEKKVTVREA
jgi:hypothetical protein